MRFFCFSFWRKGIWSVLFAIVLGSNSGPHKSFQILHSLPKIFISWKKIAQDAKRKKEKSLTSHSRRWRQFCQDKYSPNICAICLHCQAYIKYFMNNGKSQLLEQEENSNRFWGLLDWAHPSPLLFSVVLIQQLTYQIISLNCQMK